MRNYNFMFLRASEIFVILNGTTRLKCGLVSKLTKKHKKQNSVHVECERSHTKYFSLAKSLTVADLFSFLKTLLMYLIHFLYSKQENVRNTCGFNSIAKTTILMVASNFCKVP